MQETTITITVRSDGETVVKKEATVPEIEETQVTAAEQENADLVSDLANVCEYLEESEVISIRLITAKCKRRKKMTE